MSEPLHPTRSAERIDADVRAEVEGWIEKRVAALVARGVDSAGARRRAIEEFGEVAGTRRPSIR
jgi:hypothetical protein